MLLMFSSVFFIVPDRRLVCKVDNVKRADIKYFFLFEGYLLFAARSFNLNGVEIW